MSSEGTGRRRARGGRGRGAGRGSEGGPRSKGGAGPRSRSKEGARDGRRGPPKRGGKRRRGRRGGDEALAPLTKRATLDLDRDRAAPLSEAEIKEAEGHLTFLRRFKTALRLSFNAKEDLLVNGARAPEDRGVLKHLFHKVDNAAVASAIAREPLKSNTAQRAAFLAGVVRLAPDPTRLLAYLETLAAGSDRRIAARAFGATVERIDFTNVSAAQLGRLLEVCRGTFDGPDRVQAFFGLLDSATFSKALETHLEALPASVRDDLWPLASAHRVVTSGAALPDDEAARGRVAAGVQRWVDSPAETLRSYPLDQRIRLAHFVVEGADGTAPDALPPALMDSIPRDHEGYAQLGLVWSEKLMRAHQTEAAVGLLRQVCQSHPDRRDAAKRLRALEGERFGPLVLGEARRGELRAAFWLEEAAHGWVRIASADETPDLQTRARWQAELSMPQVAPMLSSGRGPGGRGFILVSAEGHPLEASRRGLMEALRLARDAVTILRGLAAVGVELPDAALSRFWMAPRRGGLSLVDLHGATRTDPARAAMTLAEPAQALARGLLWDEARDALRADLPEGVRGVLSGRTPVTLLARALILAATR